MAADEQGRSLMTIDATEFRETGSVLVDEREFESRVFG
jgi:hypothetical protein